jgi:ubiquinone/menaquinone biosynthesis C-methylase UbiE
MLHMSAYGSEYKHYGYCVERTKRPSRRIYDIFRHISPVHESVKMGDKILDIGSGVGENGHDLRWLGVTTYSMDISMYAQQRSTEVFGIESHNVKLVGNALDLPFQNRSFNFATCLDVFEHLTPDQIFQVLNELRRVVSGNRMFIKLTPTEDAVNIDVDPTHITKWSESKWTEWFNKNMWKTLTNPKRNLFGKTIHGNFLLEKI